MGNRQVYSLHEKSLRSRKLAKRCELEGQTEREEEKKKTTSLKLFYSSNTNFLKRKLSIKALAVSNVLLPWNCRFLPDHVWAKKNGDGRKKKKRAPSLALARVLCPRPNAQDRDRRRTTQSVSQGSNKKALLTRGLKKND